MANQLGMAKVQSILTLHQQGCSNRKIAELLGIHRQTVSEHLLAGGSKCTTPPPSGSANLPAGSNCTTPPPAGSANPPTGSNCTTNLPAGSGQPGGGLIPASAAYSLDPPEARPAEGSAGGSGPLSECEPFRLVIVAKLEQGLTAQRIWQDLVSEHGFTAAYDSVKRFVRKLGESVPLPFRRMEVAPGIEVQVDFGKGAPICPPGSGRRRPHVFRIVLSFSRKGYSEAVFRQTTDDFLACLENAFWSFGGVPRTIVIDNLKAAVAKADWFDPELHPKIRAFCEYYGTVILPTRPYTPRHKGKIEAGIKYVQANGLKGHQFTSLPGENQHLWHWELTVADTRIHGTTRKQVGKLFAEVERAALLPLPAERFPNFHEAERSVHRDGHVEVAQAYYTG